MSVSMSSSASESSAAHVHLQQPSSHDAVIAVLCALRTTLRWPSSKVAKRLGVPELVVEEALRVGTSSSMLRAHFSSWAHESNELPDGIPPGMVAAAIRQCDGGGRSVGRSESCSTLDDFGDDRGEGLFDDEDMRCVTSGMGRGVSSARLDPKLKEHFAFLQNSVGYNFMSILNDPTEVEIGKGRGSEWGSWLGSTVQDAFDYGNPQTGGGARGGLSAAQLMSQHPVQASTFQPYLQYVGNVIERRKQALAEFHRWREEVQRVQHGDESRTSPTKGSDGMDRHPWPSDVALHFFSTEFNVAKLISDTLPDGTLSNEEVVSTECITDSLEALESACDDLHRSLLRIEHCLFVHVQKRSDDFFAASHSFDELHENTEEALANLYFTKDVLITRGDAVVTDFANVARLHRRKQHQQLLESRVRDVLEVVKHWEFVDSWMATEARSIEMLPQVAKSLLACQSLMYEKEGVAALLGDLACGRHIPLNVSRAKAALITLVSAAGSSALGDSLNALLARGGALDWTPVTAPLEAAAMIGCLPQVMQQHQQVVLDNMWLWARQTIASSYDAATAASVATLAARLPHPKAERVAFLKPTRSWGAAVYGRFVMKTLGEVQERISTIVCHWQAVREYAHDLWEQNLSTISAHNSSSSPSIPQALHANVFESLLVVAAHHCVVDLITVRYDENAAMRLKDLVPIIRQCFQFSHAVDAITGDGHPSSTSRGGDTKGVGGARSSQQEFRNVLIGQCKVLFQKQHARLQERVLQAVSTEEQWEPVSSVDSMFQEICTELCRSDDDAVEAFHRLAVDFDCNNASSVCHAGGGLWTAGRCATTLGGGGLPAGVSNDDTTAAVDGGFNPDDEPIVQSHKLYVLDPAEAISTGTAAANDEDPASLAGASADHGFVVSHSILLLLQTLHEYDRLLGTFPFLAFDVLGKIYEALKLYDGQCAAMILGASAVDMGILSSISVLHLGLASQCTGCLAELTPLLQKRFRRFLPSDKLSSFIEKDFDRARREFIAHRDAFLLKIISVVKERVDQQSAAFQPLHWLQRGNGFVMGMLRELAKVLKTLRPLLRVVDVRAVAIPLVAHCTIRLRAAAQSVPKGLVPDARPQVLSDIHLFKANVEKFGFLALRCVEVTSVLAYDDGQAALCCTNEREDPADSTSVEAFQNAILNTLNE